MPLSRSQEAWLRESATNLTEQYPQLNAHFARTEEGDAETTISYIADAPKRLYSTDPPQDGASVEGACTRALADTVAAWRAVSIEPVVTERGSRERPDGHAERFWTVTG
jgi:hypothetical protein